MGARLGEPAALQADNGIEDSFCAPRLRPRPNSGDKTCSVTHLLMF